MKREPSSPLSKLSDRRHAAAKRYARLIGLGVLGMGIFVAPLMADEPAAFSMKLVTAEGSGADIGRVMVHPSPHGAVFVPALSGLPPGLHGFHLHESADCSPALKEGKKSAAAAAGGHYDPEKTGAHDTPWGEGHRGDLPALYVDASGKAQNPVLAPRLKVSEVGKLALMIHAGGDNHADHPEPLGGGGSRLACGVAVQTQKK